MRANDRIFDLVSEMRKIVEIRAGTNSHAAEVASRLENMNLTRPVMNNQSARLPRHSEALDDAIDAVVAPEFSLFVRALRKAKNDIRWRIDKGMFYPEGADLGQGYINGNLNCEFIGPDDGVFFQEDFRFGLFMLKPKLFYRDHSHPAPELYIPLTGPSGWRFEAGPWEDCIAGDCIWNETSVTHATRVYGTPFLAIFAWTKDVNIKCDMMRCDDWDAVQAALEI